MFNLLATGGRTRSKVIDKDKRFRRKRRSKLDAYMDTLSSRRKTLCAFRICEKVAIVMWSLLKLNDARTLLIIVSEINKQISIQCCSMNETVHVDIRSEENTENCWAIADQEFKILKFISTSEDFESRDDWRKLLSIKFYL